MTDVTDEVEGLEQEQEPEPAPPRRPYALVRLYRGETAFDFMGRRRWWYLISGVVIAAGLVSLSTRGLNLGIDFRGGTAWEVPANGVSISAATDAVKSAGVTPSLVQVVGVGSNAHVHVEADLKNESDAQRTETENRVAQALALRTGSSIQQAQQNIKDVGPTWGSDITHKAVLAVIVFFGWWSSTSRCASSGRWPSPPWPRCCTTCSWWPASTRCRGCR